MMVCTHGAENKENKDFFLKNGESKGRLSSTLAGDVAESALLYESVSETLLLSCV